MKAEDLIKFTKFMYNRFNREESCKIFGNVMGAHFASKFPIDKSFGDGLWNFLRDVEPDNLQKVLDYMDEIGYNG